MPDGAVSPSLNKPSRNDNNSETALCLICGDALIDFRPTGAANAQILATALAEAGVSLHYIARLVMVTQGAEGVSGYARDGRLRIPTRHVAVADTVGAAAITCGRTGADLPWRHEVHGLVSG